MVEFNITDSNTFNEWLEKYNLLSDVAETIGDLIDLDTTDKTSVVNAVNELNSAILSLSSLTATDLQDLLAAVNGLNNVTGDLANLITVDKANLVAAINECKSTILTNDADIITINSSITSINSAIATLQSDLADALLADEVILNKAISGGYGVATGFSNNYSITTNPTFTSLGNGGRILSTKFNAENTSTTINLNVNSIGSELVYNSAGEDIYPGQINTDDIYILHWTGSFFRIMNNLRNHSDIAYETFLGNGSLTTFTLANVPSSDDVIRVYIGGTETTDFSIDGNKIVFTSPPASGFPGIDNIGIVTEINTQRPDGSPLNQYRGSNISSGSTTTLDVPGDFFQITGTSTISNFGTASRIGIEKTVYFASSLTITHNATNLILPSGENINTVSGDRAVFRSMGDSKWMCIQYTRGSGIIDFFSFHVPILSDGDLALAVNLPIGFDIISVTTKSTSGTATAEVKINSTVLGGSANSVSVSENTQTHSSSNSVSIGDDLSLSVSSNSNAAGVVVTMKILRTT